jgi:hypothetical protein
VKLLIGLEEPLDLVAAGKELELPMNRLKSPGGDVES